MRCGVFTLRRMEERPTLEQTTLHAQSAEYADEDEALAAAKERWPLQTVTHDSDSEEEDEPDQA